MEVMDNKKYAWSLDGENYDHGIFDTIEEAIIHVNGNSDE